jgi:hypothetical protein
VSEILSELTFVWRERISLADHCIISSGSFFHLQQLVIAGWVPVNRVWGIYYPISACVNTLHNTVSSRAGKTVSRKIACALAIFNTG